MSLVFSKFSLQSLVLTFFTLLLISCQEEETKYPEVKSVENIPMIIASKKLTDIVTDDCIGNLDTVEVYAAKINNSKQWESFSYLIKEFEYKEGTEYNIKVEKKNFYDPRMSVVYWAEFTLLKVISKDEKNSEELPESFMP